MHRPALPPLLLLLALPALAWLGCHGPSGNERENARGYRILGFTLLGDSAVALRYESWEVRHPPDTASWPQRGFALVDRKRATIGPLDSLPVSAGPTFPDWFFACDAGRPVSVHPEGAFGPAGACTMAQAPAISPEGYALAFADSQGRVNLLSKDLEPITYRAGRADSVKPLEYASAVGRVFVLEWHGRGDTVLWRGFANDDPSGYDSAWLAGPRQVRVHGAGTRLVCGEAEASADSPACWSPGITGFSQALTEAGAASAAAAVGADPIVPEWDPATGILAWLAAPGQIEFLDPETGERKVFDAGALLKAYPR